MKRSIYINQHDAFMAIEPIVFEILQTIKITLSQLSPEITHEVFEKGIYLTGGGSLYKRY